MLISWPAPFLFIKEVENHKQIKEEIFTTIQEQSKDKKFYNYPNQTRKNSNSVWNCEVITSFFERDSEEVKSIFTEKIVNEIIDPALQELFNHPKYIGKKNPKQTILEEIWYNVYEPGYSQEIHEHCGSTFSGIYLLELNEPNTTVFYAHSTNYEYADSPGSLYLTDNIKEGNIIIFPSEFVHSVKESTNYRISISFNLKCLF